MKKNRQQLLNNKKRKQGEAKSNREREIKQSATIRLRLEKEAEKRHMDARYRRRQHEMMQDLSRLNRRGETVLDIAFLGMLGDAIARRSEAHKVVTITSEVDNYHTGPTINLDPGNYTVKEV